MRLNLFTIGEIPIRGYGTMIAIGVILCILMGGHRAKKHGLSDDIVYDIALYGLISGFIGSKLLFVIVEFDFFLQDPFSALGSRGFVVYGGIIAGVLAAIIYCRLKKVSFLTYFDLLMPSVALAQGFGRIGCLLAGCCYGRETTSAFGIIFPEGCQAPAGVKLIPTQIISSIGNFIIVLILIWFAKRAKHIGSVGILYMVLYSIGRFLIEMLRSDDRGAIGVLSTSQIISIGILLLAIGLYRFVVSKNLKEDISDN